MAKIWRQIYYLRPFIDDLMLLFKDFIVDYSNFSHAYQNSVPAGDFNFDFRLNGDGHKRGVCVS